MQMWKSLSAYKIYKIYSFILAFLKVINRKITLMSSWKQISINRLWQQLQSLSLCGYNWTRQIPHSLQNCSCWVKLHAENAGTANLRPCIRLATWPGPLKDFIVVLKPFLPRLCWKISLFPIQHSLADSSIFFSRIILYFAAFILPSVFKALQGLLQKSIPSVWLPWLSI